LGHPETAELRLDHRCMKEVSIMTTWIILAAAAVGAAGLWYSWKRRRDTK
jgi:LPXTG-motif cell wall-anchored protein